jgi:transposase
VRVNKLLRQLLRLIREVVIEGHELTGLDEEGARPRLVVRLRLRSRHLLRCGRCGEVSPRYDRGGGERRWRHLDVGFATCELRAAAPRVSCRTHGVTVAELAFARHDSSFTRDFEDLLVYDAIRSSKQSVADRFGVSWRAVNNACERILAEALGSVDLLSGLVAISIDEVKYKKGQRYLTVVCNHFTGKVVWAAKGRSKETVGAFFDALGPTRSASLQFVTCDGAGWIHDVVKERAEQSTICLDAFHIVKWATDALDETRREEWNALRASGAATAAKELKGLRYLLLRNWENLSPLQKATIRELEVANRRLLRAWQLKEELREVLRLPLLAAGQALDDWLYFASRSRLSHFVKLARTIRAFRSSIEAMLEWKLTNGIAESVNAAIGRIRSNARGFHEPQAFITMIMLDRSGLGPELPWHRET